MMLVIFPMFTCTTRLILCGAMDMTIHNQYPDIELVSPVYFCNHGTYNEYPVERTDVSAMMKISFNFFVLGKLPGGILMYKVRRKGSAKSDHQSSTDTTSTEPIENTSKMMRLLMDWKIENFWWPRVRIMLVEYDNELVLNELEQLYDSINDIPPGYSPSRWLMCDNTVLVATCKAVQKVSPGLKITISKGAKDEYTKSASWIDSERQVSSLMVIYSMLIYIVSLTLQSAMDVIINNRCFNIELTSPVYFTKSTVRRIHLPQRVYSKNRIKVNLRTDIHRSTSGGALLYHLQKTGSSESGDQSDTNKDMPISTQLLVIWELRIDRLYSHTWLIEHDSTLIWNEDKLKRLHDAYNSQYNVDLIFNEGRWLLGDNTMLQTMCETSHKGDFKMEITISEEGQLSPQKPLRVDPNR
jgi:hypothetical protein